MAGQSTALILAGQNVDKEPAEFDKKAQAIMNLLLDAAADPAAANASGNSVLNFVERFEQRNVLPLTAARLAVVLDAKAAAPEPTSELELEPQQALSEGAQLLQAERVQNRSWAARRSSWPG